MNLRSPSACGEGLRGRRREGWVMEKEAGKERDKKGGMREGRGGRDGRGREGREG